LQSVYNEKQNELDFRNIKELEGSLSSFDTALANETNGNETIDKLYDDLVETSRENENTTIDYNDVLTQSHDTFVPSTNKKLNDSLENKSVSPAKSQTREHSSTKKETTHSPVMMSNVNIEKCHARKKLSKKIPTATLPLPPLKSTTPPKLAKKVEERRHVSFKVDVNSLQLKHKPFKIPVNDDADEVENEEELNLRIGDNWLLKWCILREACTRQCATAFEMCDYEQKGFLTLNQLMNAIGSIVNLNNFKKSYLISVLNLCEIRTNGVHLNMFNILVALARRVNHLDEKWFGDILPQLDLSTIENKMFKVRSLWSYLVDNRTKTINIAELLIEFEAGGVTREHIDYAREKFKEKESFDLLDYLTYIPLFLFIHDRIVVNPFDKRSDI
jgi:hypothetical protein